VEHALKAAMRKHGGVRSSTAFDLRTRVAAGMQKHVVAKASNLSQILHGSKEYLIKGDAIDDWYYNVFEWRHAEGAIKKAAAAWTVGQPGAEIVLSANDEQAQALVAARFFFLASKAVDSWYHNAFHHTDWYRAEIIAGKLPMAVDGGTPLLEGVLQKMGSLLGGLSWNDRWVRLDTEHLSIFTHKSDAETSGRSAKTVIPISEIAEVKYSDKRAYAFKVKTSISKGRKLGRKGELSITFDAVQEATFRKWFDALQQLVGKKNGVIMLE